MTYQFDFSKMVVGDIYAFMSGDPCRIGAVVGRLFVGDLSRVSLREFANVLAEFARQLNEWNTRLGTEDDDLSDGLVDDDAVRDMLDGIEGL